MWNTSHARAVLSPVCSKRVVCCRVRTLRHCGIALLHFQPCTYLLVWLWFSPGTALGSTAHRATGCLLCRPHEARPDLYMQHHLQKAKSGHGGLPTSKSPPFHRHCSNASPWIATGHSKQQDLHSSVSSPAADCACVLVVALAHRAAQQDQMRVPCSFPRQIAGCAYRVLDNLTEQI